MISIYIVFLLPCLGLEHSASALPRPHQFCHGLGLVKTASPTSLGMTLCSLTGRADVLTLVNPFGHCRPYSGILELETAMANQVKIQDLVLPANISPTDNKVVHLCWDNFDINEETPSGAGTTHSTHGIVIQELTSGAQLSLEHVFQRTEREDRNK